MSAAISAGDLALAMSRANNSARLAGADMDKFIGYVTTVADVSQKSAESVGESFKTIFSRFGNVKAGKYVATVEDQNSEGYSEEDFEAVNDIETVLTRVGIKIRENAQTWRDIDDILEDIGEKWNTWDTTTQNAVATTVAGTRQRENVITLFENWDEVSKYAEISENAYGTATKKMEAYSDSVEASKNRITNAIEKIALDLDISDKVKKFYSVIATLTENLWVLSTAIMAMKAESILTTLGNGVNRMGSRLMMMGMKDNAPLLQGWNAAKDRRNNELINTYQSVQIKRFNDSLALNTAQLDESTQTVVKKIAVESAAMNAEEQNTMKKMTSSILEGANQEAIANDINETNILAMKKVVQSAVHEKLISVEEEELKLIESSNVDESQLDTQKKLLAKAYKDAVIKINQNGGAGALGVYTNNLAMDYSDSQTREKILKEAKAARMSGMLGMAGMMGGGWVGNTLSSAVSDNSTIQSIGTMAGGMLFHTVGASFPKNKLKLSEQKEAVANRRAELSASINASRSKIANYEHQAEINNGRLVSNTEINRSIQEEQQKIGNLTQELQKTNVPISAYASTFAPVILSAILIGVSAFIDYYNTKVEALKQGFSDAVDKYNNYTSLSATADQYNKLVSGVDMYGNNVSLSEDDYATFIEKSNELAEAFPQLVVNVDDAGNKFLGLNGSVTNVADAIDDLTVSAKNAADAALFKKDGVLWFQTSVFAENLKDVNDLIQQTRSTYVKTNNIVAKHNAATNNLDMSGINYSWIMENGEYVYSVDEDMVRSSWEDLMQTQWETDTNPNKVDFDSYLKENENSYQDYLTNQKNNLDFIVQSTADTYKENALVLENQLEEYNASMTDEYMSYLNYIGNAGNAKLADMMDNLTTEEKAVLYENIKKIDASQSAEQIEEELMNLGNALPDLLSRLEFKKDSSTGESMLTIAAKDQTSYTNIEQMKESRSQLLDALKEVYGDEVLNWSDTQKEIAENLGFKINEHGKVYDTEDITNKLAESLFGEGWQSIGESKRQWDKISSAWNLTDMNPTQVQNLYNAANSGWIDENTDASIIERVSHSGGAAVTNSTEAYYRMLSAQNQTQTALAEGSEFKTGANTYLNKLTETDLNGNFILDAENSKGEILEFAADMSESARNTIYAAAQDFQDGYANIIDTAEEGTEEYDNAVTQLYDDFNNAVSEALVTNELDEYANYAKQLATEVFSGIDTGSNGLIDSMSEISAAVDKMVSSYDKLKTCREEQNSLGDISVQSLMSLLSESDEYIKLIDFEADGIKLKSNAEQEYIEIQKNALIANLESAKADILIKKQQTEENLRLLLAGNKTLQLTDSEVKANNDKIKSYNALGEAVHRAALEQNYYNAMSEGGSNTAVQNEALAALNAFNSTEYEGTAEVQSNIDLDERSAQTQIESYLKQLGMKVKYTYDDNGEQTGFELLNDEDNLGTFEETYELYDKLITKMKDTTTAADFEKNIKSASGDAKTYLEKIKEILSAIDKEYYQIIKSSETLRKSAAASGQSLAVSIKKATDSMKEYYDIRESLLNTSIVAATSGINNLGLSSIYSVNDDKEITINYEAIKNAVDSGISDDNYDKLMDYVNTIVEYEAELANIDDDQIQDQLDMYTIIGEVNDEQIKLYGEKVATADTDKEALEYLKEYNDAVREQIKLKKQLAEYQKELYEFQLDYLEGDPASTKYTTAMSNAVSALKTAVNEAKNLLDTTYSQLYDYYMNSEGMSAAEADVAARNHSDYQEAMKSYLEAVKSVGDLYVEEFNDKIDAVESKIKELETSKPNEWASDWDSSTNKATTSAFSKMEDYYDDLISYYEKEASIANETLNKYASELTDDQIEDLVEKYNDAMKNVRDNELALLEDKKDYQESVYSALTDEISRYKDQLEEEKELVEEYYDKELEKLNDKNTAIERTNKLIELQQNLQNSMKEKTKTFRAGIGWVN